MALGDISYRFNPLVDELYVVKKGRYKGKAVIAGFSYGHTVLYDLKGNYVTDYNTGYSNDGYLQELGTIIRPRWDKLRTINSVIERQVIRK